MEVDDTNTGKLRYVAVRLHQMARMGHDDMRAALIYQRATSEADEKIADQLSKVVDEHRTGKDEHDEDGPEATPVG